VSVKVDVELFGVQLANREDLTPVRTTNAAKFPVPTERCRENFFRLGGLSSYIVANFIWSCHDRVLKYTQTFDFY
jgi:hypothetical protein